MSILVNKDSKVLVQGITGKEGTFHTEMMLKYGTNVVAGVTPKKGGTKHLGVPVFNTVKEAVEETGADTSIIFVPAPFAADAALEAINSGIKMVVTITEGIPVKDMIKVKAYLNQNPDVRMIGPNCPGIITPKQTKIGIMPGFIFEKGPIGVVSRSGTITYESVYQISKHGLGQSTVVGIGGDPVLGSTMLDIIKLFNEDDETEAVLMIGEIGGTAEEEAAEWISKNMKKPVIAYIAGVTAPPGKRMGHAGAIISGGKGTAQEKMRVLRENGVTVVENPAEIGSTVAKVYKEKVGK